MKATALYNEKANHEPNAETLAAMADARAGRFVGDPIDPTSVESLLKSAGL